MLICISFEEGEFNFVLFWNHSLYPAPLQECDNSNIMLLHSNIPSLNWKHLDDRSADISPIPTKAAEDLYCSHTSPRTDSQP